MYGEETSFEGLSKTESPTFRLRIFPKVLGVEGDNSEIRVDWMGDRRYGIGGAGGTTRCLEGPCQDGTVVFKGNDLSKRRGVPTGGVVDVQGRVGSEGTIEIYFNV